MYLAAVRLSRAFLLAAFVAGILCMLVPRAVPLWVPLGLAVGWAAALLYAVLHAVRTRRREFRCPHCGWVPFALPAWKCKECGLVWDSFATRGVCPGCGHPHDETACPRCRRISPNPEWVRPGERAA